MKTISVRDLRQRWPEAEKLLEVESEIVITRDNKPVARLVRIGAEKRRRKRFDPAEHERWMHKVWGTEELPDSAVDFSRDRADR